MWRAAAVFLVCFFHLVAHSDRARAEKRVALVIGNSAYVHAPELTNPKNDAADMVAALKALGLEVLEGIDLDKQGMDRKIREFAEALAGADAGVFFFAGHGLQVNGNNYLVPIDAQLSTATALEFEMVRLDLVQRVMEGESKTNILFLDACRNNPLSRNLARAMGTRSAAIGRGLAAAESGVGTLISFSTQPGNVALDGTGRNSPYSGPLAKAIAKPGEDVLTVLTAVRNEVLAATGEKQVPWENHALRARFYFNAGAPTAAAAAEAPAGAVGHAWSLVQDTEDIPALEAFRKEFGPQSPFYEQLAANRIAAVRSVEAKRKEATRLSMLADEADMRAQATGRTQTVSATLEALKGRAWLGVKMTSLLPEASRAIGLGNRSAVLVENIISPGPAQKAGMLPGDVILKVAGADIASAREVSAKIAEMKPGASVTLERWRGLAEAIPQLRRRAEAGRAGDAALLAKLYLSGVGVPKDPTESVRLYRIAAEGGNSSAMFTLATGLEVGADVIAKDEAEAARWFRKAADAGHVNSMVRLADLLSDGTAVVAKDAAEAARWYVKAAELGNADAMAAAAAMFANGKGVTKDEREAVRWYLKAAEAGDAFSMHMMAALQINGKGTAKNPSESARWMFAAIQKGRTAAVKDMTADATPWTPEFRKELQKRLKAANLYKGPIDGNFGPGVHEAINKLAAQSKPE